MILSNVAMLDFEDITSQHLVDVHRYLLMYNGVDEVFDRGNNRLLLKMAIDWENAPDVFVAYEEACDKVAEAMKLTESQLQNINSAYCFEWNPYKYVCPVNYE